MEHVIKNKNESSNEELINDALDYSHENLLQSYLLEFPNEKVIDFCLLPNTQESTVVEINGEYIVKSPKAHRCINGIRKERVITNFVRGLIVPAIPNMTIYDGANPFARYKKITGIKLEKTKYLELSDHQKTMLAKQFARFIWSIHSVKLEDIDKGGIELDSSWDIDCENIESILGNENDTVISSLLGSVLNNHSKLEVTGRVQVFGHFDLHSGNFLVNAKSDKLEGVIDFGNSRIGDLHQDLSSMFLSIPELAEEIIDEYELLSKFKVNRVRTYHYTSITYLSLLSSLKLSGDDAYQYWLDCLHQWYLYLLNKKAQQKISLGVKKSNLPSDIKSWLASNVIKNAPEIDLQKKLWEQGVSHLDVAIELELIKTHPYTHAGLEIFKTLKKRDWLLATCNALHSMDKRYCQTIEKRVAPKFRDFVREYYSKQLPVVLSDGFHHWPACTKWTPEFLKEYFSDRQIEVQFGRDNDPLYERNSLQHKKLMTMGEYISLIESVESSNDFYMTANNTRSSACNLEGLFEDVSNFGDGYRDPETVNSHNYFWFGPKGTYTPLHHDLTNNMLVQIYGRKRVTLIPAMQVPWVYNDKGVYSASSYPEFDKNRHPALNNVTPLEFILNPGEALFIPIGWWHCVEALDVAISLVFTDFKINNSFSSGFNK